MSQLVSCRYNPSHKVKSSKLMFHEDKCPNKNTDKIKSCPFNPNHKIHRDKFEDHMNTCPNKPEVDFKFHNELRNYAENRVKEDLNNEDKNEKNEKISRNDENNIIKPIEIVNLNKKKIREEEKSMKKLLI